MNRLVLVGNGFDLAAGLPTSYEHFLVDYFKKGMMKCLGPSDGTDLDKIMTIKLSKPLDKWGNPSYIRETVTKISGIDDILKNREIYYFKNKNDKPSSEALFEIDIKSKLFQDMLGDYNWKDIESFYFNRVSAIYEQEVIQIEKKYYRGDELTKKLKQNRQTFLVSLNNEFEDLKLKIIEYLCKVEGQKRRPFHFIEKLKEPLKEETFKRFFNKGKYVGETENQIGNIKFANFNYTFTLEESIRGICSQNDVFYIHGLTYRKKDIIFGYGDDTHPIYKELEQTGDDEYLKHLKSFHYPLNQEYIQLMDYIEHDQFEVIIAGHSLGISDRVLLKSIFEHDNCKCIRFLHRGRDDEKQHMKSRYMALSRHFDNKMIMRNKIVPFDMADELC